MTDQPVALLLLLDWICYGVESTFSLALILYMKGFGVFISSLHSVCFVVDGLYGTVQ